MSVIRPRKLIVVDYKINQVDSYKVDEYLDLDFTLHPILC